MALFKMSDGVQTQNSRFRENDEMEDLSSPRIRSTERWRKGMVVVFDDGMTALYSPELLYAILAKAEILDDLPNPDEE